MADQPVAELLSAADAFGAAVLEMEGEDSPSVTPDLDDLVEGEPVLGDIEEADAAFEEQSVSEKADQEGEDDESIFGDLEDSEAEEEGEPEPEVDPWELEFEVDGATVTASEMRDGYLRQADYTKKTQALAEQRKEFEATSAAAKKLYDQLALDAPATIAFLAAEVGLIDAPEQLAEKVKALQGTWKPPLTGEALEAEIERRVEARIAQHPTVQQAEAEAAMAGVDRAIADIEKQHKVKLTTSDRRKLLGRAMKANTSDLALVFTAMKAEADAKRRLRREAAATATRRPGTRDDTDTDKPAEVRTVQDAFNAAIAEESEAA